MSVKHTAVNTIQGPQTTNRLLSDHHHVRDRHHLRITIDFRVTVYRLVTKVTQFLMVHYILPLPDHECHLELLLDHTYLRRRPHYIKLLNVAHIITSNTKTAALPLLILRVMMVLTLLESSTTRGRPATSEELPMCHLLGNESSNADAIRMTTQLDQLMPRYPLL